MYLTALEVIYNSPQQRSAAAVKIDDHHSNVGNNNNNGITTTTTSNANVGRTTMKMEVLARNQFQAQFDGIGSTKATDWTKPLTPPTSNIHHHQIQHQQQQQQPPQQLQQTATQQQQLVPQQQQLEDEYDEHHPLEHLEDDLQQRRQMSRHHNHHHHHHHHHHHAHHNQQQQQPPSNAPHPDDHSAISGELSLRLQSELRAAKSRNLSCTEVLLPADLLDCIAADMVAMAEKEPCGIRGCAIYIEFEDEPGNSRRIASLQVGTDTVATFELYLTLRHDQSGWTAKLPQFLKNLARRSTIIISRDYTLIKNKLYNSFLE